MEGVIKDLTKQLSNQEAETQSVCTALQEQNKSLHSQLKKAVEDSGKLETQVRDAMAGLEDARKKSREDEEVLTKWQGR